MFEDLRAEILNDNSGKSVDIHLCHLRENGQIQIRGKKLVDFTSFDILGVNEDKEFIRAAQQALQHGRIGASSSRRNSGTYDAHFHGEKRLAEFIGTEAALTFSSKNQAIFSLITSLLKEGDSIFVDGTVQSPVVDAAYLVGVDCRYFDSFDAMSVGTEFAKLPISKGRKFIYIESLSAITGETSNFDAALAIARKSGAYIIVDESAALGILGLRGAGGVELRGVFGEVLAVVGDLGLGLGISGGFVATHKFISNNIISRSKTFALEPSPSPFLCAAIERAVSICELSHAHREKILTLTYRLRDGLALSGIETLSGQNHIVSIKLTNRKAAEAAQVALISKGFLVDALPYPSHLNEAGIIRVIVSRFHIPTQIDQFLGAISEIFRR